MPFLPPNQQRQSTEGNKTAIIYLFKMTLIFAAKPRSHYSETAKIDILFASSKHTR